MRKLMTLLTAAIAVGFAIPAAAETQCQALFGFTAATGNSFENHDISSWSVLGTPINYVNFASTNGLNLVGSASQFGAVLRLTPAIRSQAGAAWFTTPQDFLGGFDTTFSFNISGASSPPADGLAFVIQNSHAGISALGINGGGIGFSGISNSLAVEFDTFFNSGFHDPSVPHVSVMTRGQQPNSPDHALAQLGSTPVASLSGAHTARILYAPGTLSVFFDDLVSPILTVSVDLAEIGGRGCMPAPAPAMDIFGYLALAVLLPLLGLFVLRRRHTAV